MQPLRKRLKDSKHQTIARIMAGKIQACVGTGVPDPANISLIHPGGVENTSCESLLDAACSTEFILQYRTSAFAPDFGLAHFEKGWTILHGPSLTNACFQCWTIVML
jgi:hypothetical protein